MNIYLIRHGESIGNVDNQLYTTIPDNQITLTTLGETQAKLAGTNLSIELLKQDSLEILMYTSPWKRAQQTKDLIISSLIENNITSIKDVQSSLIHEKVYCHSYQDMSSYKFLQEEEHKEINDFGIMWHKIDNKESYVEVKHRAEIFWNKLRLDYLYNPIENIVIVSHGLFLRMLDAVITNKDVNDFDSLVSFDNCQIIHHSI